MSELLIGLDLGTTILKGAVFISDTGRCLATAQKRLPLKMTRNGGREQNVTALSRALDAVMSELRHELGKQWEKVAGIGLAAQGGSSSIVDRKSGTAKTPLLLWNDKSCVTQRRQVIDMRPATFWRKHTFRDFPGVGLARMLRFKKLCTSRNLYAGAGELVYFRLTGVWQQDACNALQIGCYNARSRKLDQRLLDLAGVPVSFVAPMREKTNPISAAAAKRFRLPRETPVAGPYGDHEAGILSAAKVSTKPLQCSLGTAWVGNFHLPQNVKTVNPIQLVIASGKKDLSVQPLLTGNVTWDWALKCFADTDHPKALKRAAAIFRQRLLPTDGLCGMSWLNMANPLGDNLGGAALTGIGPQTTPEDLLRATACSMAFEFARVFAEIYREKLVDSLVLGGGASNGLHFRKLFASLAGRLPVYVVKNPDLIGARGALSSFSSQACNAPAVRVTAPARPIAREILSRYSSYLETFDKLYGNAAIGKPVTVRKGKSQ